MRHRGDGTQRSQHQLHDLGLLLDQVLRDILQAARREVRFPEGGFSGPRRAASFSAARRSRVVAVSRSLASRSRAPVGPPDAPGDARASQAGDPWSPPQQQPQQPTQDPWGQQTGADDAPPF